MTTSVLPTSFPTIHWVAITCAETYNETMGKTEVDGVTGSGERYAQSFESGIAAVAGVTKSRIIDVAAMNNPVNG